MKSFATYLRETELPTQGDNIDFEMDETCVSTYVLESEEDYIVVAGDPKSFKMLEGLFESSFGDNSLADLQIKRDMAGKKSKKEELKAWQEKYNKYLGGNGDKLADGFFEAYLDTGILTDATEEDEFNKAVDDVFGGDSARAEYELFGNEDLKRKHLPITYAMHKEFEDIMGGPVGSSTGPDDEDNVMQAANILSLSEEQHGYNNTETSVDDDVEDVNEELNSLRRTLGLDEAEYQGRKVKLNKPMQGDVKKFKVYVKDPKTGNVKKVNFGDPNMRIKKSNPARRKSFRARHNCDNPGPKTKARYWSCRKW